MRTAQLEQVSETIDYGVTASASTQPVGPKFLRITDIQDGSVDWSSVPYCINPEKKADAKELKSGDIVFARTGATTGKSFLIKECPEKAVFASYLIRVRPNSEIDPSYLAHFFNSPFYWAQISNKAQGAAQPGVNSSKLKELNIPLPKNVKEQKRIAAILDQADALRQFRRRAITRLNDLSQSIFYEMFHPDADNEIQLSNYFSEIKMGPFGSLLHKADYIENGIPLINPTHIIDGEIIPDPSFSISPAKAKELHKYLLKEGDIILGRRGDMGRCAVVDGKMEGFLCGTGSMILRPDKSKVDPYFAADLIRSKKVIKEIEAVASGVTMLNLNSKSLNRVFVPKVDRAKQKEYFQKINSLQAKKSYMQESLEKFERLFLSVQQRAFRGEL